MLAKSTGLATFEACVLALEMCGTTPEGALAVLRLPLGAELCRLLRGYLNRKDVSRMSALLRMLSCCSAHLESQHLLLRSREFDGLLDLLCDMLEGPSVDYPPLSCRREALLTLCHLAQPDDNKGHFLSCPRSLSALVEAVESGSSDPACLAYAATALWALVHHGERVKAQIKQISDGALLDRLKDVQRVLAAGQFLHPAGDVLLLRGQEALGSLLELLAL